MRNKKLHSEKFINSFNEQLIDRKATMQCVFHKSLSIVSTLDVFITSVWPYATVNETNQQRDSMRLSLSIFNEKSYELVTSGSCLIILIRAAC